MQFGLVLSILCFALLFVVAVTRAIRHAHAPSRWLAGSFASLLLTSWAAARFGSDSVDARVLVLAFMTGLTLHPVALLRAATTFDRVAPIVHRTVESIAALLLATTAGVLFLVPQETGRATVSATLMTVVTLVALGWVLVCTWVAARLCRHGIRATSAVGRYRSWTIAAGVALLAPALAIPLWIEGASSLVAINLVLASCVVTWLGYVAPSWLRAVWSRRDGERLAEAELDALRATDGDLGAWVEVLADIWDADAAWLHIDHEPSVAHGITADEVAALTPADLGDDQTSVVPVDGGWVVAVRVASACLGVRTGRDPFLMGDHDSELLRSTAARMTGVVARHELEEQARRLTDEAHHHATVALRDDVLSTLSHELRTPLVTLRGVPELLLAMGDQVDDGQRRDMLERVHANAMALQRVVETSLALASLRSAGTAVRARLVPVPSILDEALAALQGKGVDTSRVAVDRTVRMQLATDPELAATAVGEVLHNALLYSTEPSTVEVSMERLDTGVRLTVADRGCGTEKDQHHAWDLFARAGHVLTREHRGLGVGLTLVAEIADHLGWDVDLVPRDGGGTVVTMDLRTLATGVRATATA